MALKDVYRFPENRRAKATDLLGQLRYVRLEANEAIAAALGDEGDDRIIEETWDTIQAAEGVLRKFSLWKVLKGLARVKLKSLHRGDYGGES